MGLMDEIRLDVQDITSNANEFGVAITFTAPTGETATINGTASKHYMNFDFDSGKNINSQNAHVTVAEALLVAEDYPVRNPAGNVNMKRHRVSFVDSTGVSGSYEITEQFPDQAVGLIVFILGNRS